MKRRVFGIVGAVVLAVLGTIALVAYVQSAKEDAIADQRPVDVYVVRQAIPAGASLTEIRSSVELVAVPERLIAPDAVTDLGVLTGDLVATAELRAGDQLLTGRLADRHTVVGVELPDGLVRLTIDLEPQRVVGGALAAGDTVGVIVSFDPFDLDTSGQAAAPGAVEATDPEAALGGTAPTTPRRTPNTTHYTLSEILVTSLQFSQRDSERVTEISSTDAVGLNGTTATVEEAPSSSLLVTLAVTPAEAEQIVFAAEFGRIWLTAEGADVDVDGTRIVTLDEAYAPSSRP